ncbi:MAG: hypothetical protein AB1894_22040 [Chloroflexota bacterium]
MNSIIQPYLKQQLVWLRLTLLVTLGINVLAFQEFVGQPGLGTAGLLGIGIVIEIALLIVALTSWQTKLLHLLDKVPVLLARLRWLNPFLFVANAALISFAIFSPQFYDLFRNTFTRLFVVWLISLVGSFLLKAWGNQQARSWLELFGISLLLNTLIYRVVSYLPDITLYPLSLNWSETSEYYYASLFFSRQIYNFAAAPTVLHPTRHLMQAVPFLLPRSPLWLHRIWQVFLWLAMPGLTAFFLVRRLEISERIKGWLTGIWAFIFILIGAVYHHLLMPVIIMLWGFDQQNTLSRSSRFFKSLLAVLLASAWAGISRVNWYPVPAMLACAIYFLQRPVEEPGNQTDTGPSSWLKRIPWRYLFPPVAWAVLGLAAALAAQAGYIAWSGVEFKQFTSSFTSQLLWYRLWPNAIYPPGILIGILLVSAPLFVLIGSKMAEPRRAAPAWRAYHPLRLLTLVAILAAFFIGSLIVSTKIGGGSNLHNMDTYMVFLLILAAFILFNKFTPDRSIIEAQSAGDADAPRQGQFARKSAKAGIALAFAMIFLFPVLSLAPRKPLVMDKPVISAVGTIAQRSAKADQNGGEVLFISNRHLLTFGYVKDVRLVTEYERVFLMEMAMAGNRGYLDRFQQDLKNQRFALIISEPFFLVEKDKTTIFGEENNAWVNEVSRYVLCYYKQDSYFQNVDVQIYAPRPKTSNCP